MPLPRLAVSFALQPPVVRVDLHLLVLNPVHVNVDRALAGPMHLLDLAKSLVAGLQILQTTVGVLLPLLSAGYVKVSAAFLILVIAYGMSYSFGVFFEPVLTEFGWSRAMTAGAFSFSHLLHSVLAIGGGSLNDRFGPRIESARYVAASR